MTPCEKLGYKVGDRFVTLESNEFVGRSKGDILELVKDDGTNYPWFKNVTTGEDLTVCYLHHIALVRSSYTSLKTGDTIEQEGKKYRVKLEEITQSDFKPGMLCRVIWGKGTYCGEHSSSDRVVFLNDENDGSYKVAYANTYGSILTGYVNTPNLRPE